MIKKLRYAFLLALLAHLLILLSYILVLNTKLYDLFQPYEPEFEKAPFTVIPAVFYPNSSPAKEVETTPKTTKNEAEKKEETSENAIEKKSTTEENAAKPSQAAVASQSKKAISTKASTAEKTSQDPLMKLLYQATAENLVYPRVARDLFMSGTVQVKFLVYPSGQLSQIKLIKSSGLGFYDDAVMTAIRSMSPVKGVSQYLSAPKYVTAVIMFGA